MAMKSQPVKGIRFGRIKAVIWKNPGFNGNAPMFNTTLARLYKDPEVDAWKETQSFGREDSLLTGRHRYSPPSAVLAFNLNTLTDSKSRPLASLLLSQFYLSLGYSNNLIYARVIEAELDNQGKLDDLHTAVEAKAKKPWADIQQNLGFYSTYLYAAACEVAPEVFPTPQDVQRALSEAQHGELHNMAFLVDTILAELTKREAAPTQDLLPRQRRTKCARFAVCDGKFGYLQSVLFCWLSPRPHSFGCIWSSHG